MKNKLLILASLILPFIAFAQNNIFYEHYTGLITEDLRITADLVSLESSFSGYYYYEFKEGQSWISSKPIALDGRVNKQKEFVLNEFGENHSFFQGTLENTKLIKGNWHNQMLDDAVAFTMKATYSPGTLALTVVESQSQEYFEKDKNLPYAKFSISALFPPAGMDKAVYHQLLKRIYYLIGFRGELDMQSDIISSIEKSYFEKFQNALQSIIFEEDSENYNWQKTIRMDVINNESSLLCLQVETFAKTGTRPGARVKKFLVFSLEDNKVVKLKDVVNEENSESLNILLQQKIRKHYHISEEKTLSQAGFFKDSIQPSNNFYIHPGGLGFYYNVYEIAPFSNGPTDLFIPWRELKGIVNEESVLRIYIR